MKDMKKIIVSVIIIGMSLTTPILPVYAINSAQQNEELELMSVVENSNIDRWAVIVGTDYNHLIYENAREAKAIYNSLLNADERWNENNTKLLISAEATKQNILDALDWLDENAGEDDVVFFLFSGHGGPCPDQPPFDEWDGTDEVIAPWDLYDDPTAIITDDTLSDKFDNISDNNIKGMFLVFSCCFSGGLFDWTNQNDIINGVESLPVQKTADISNTIIQDTNIDATGTLSTEGSLTSEQVLNILNQLPQGSNSVTIESNEIPSIEEIIKKWNAAVQDANSFTAGLTEDIDVDGRVILTSTIPHGIDYVNAVCDFLCAAIEHERTTAEELAKYTITLYRICFIPYMLLNLFNPSVWFLRVYYLIEDGGILLTWPIWKDGYPSGDPSSAKLPIIGDGDNSGDQNSQIIQQSSPTPQTQPSSQPSGQQISLQFNQLLQMMPKATTR